MGSVSTKKQGFLKRYAKLKEKVIKKVINFYEYW